MVNINGYYMVNDGFANNLVGGFEQPSPLKNHGVSSSVGIMKFHEIPNINGKKIN